jgi:hypothetical protein
MAVGDQSLHMSPGDTPDLRLQIKIDPSEIIIRLDYE